MDYFNTLPIENRWNIMLEMDSRDIEAFCVSHQGAAAICSQEEFWREKYRYDFGTKRALPWAGWRRNWKYQYFHHYYPLPPALVEYLEVYSDDAFEAVREYNIKEAEANEMDEEDLEELKLSKYVQFDAWETRYFDMIIEDAQAGREIDPTFLKFDTFFGRDPGFTMNYISIRSYPQLITKQEAREILITVYRIVHDEVAYDDVYNYVHSLYPKVTRLMGEVEFFEPTSVLKELERQIYLYLINNEYKLPPQLYTLDIFEPRMVERYVIFLIKLNKELPDEDTTE